MTPVEEAKARVAVIFAALIQNRETEWRELVLGGYSARASISGGILSAYVGLDGEYAVYAGKSGCERMITLLSGRFEPLYQSVAMGMQKTPSDGKSED